MTRASFARSVLGGVLILLGGCHEGVPPSASNSKTPGNVESVFADGPVTNRATQPAWVLIGTLNFVDQQAQQQLLRYFAENNVPVLIEGSLIHGVSVQEVDVERVKALIETNPPNVIEFSSAWR